jgi:hypothetical protein
MQDTTPSLLMPCVWRDRLVMEALAHVATPLSRRLNWPRQSLHPTAMHLQPCAPHITSLHQRLTPLQTGCYSNSLQSGCCRCAEQQIAVASHQRLIPLAGRCSRPRQQPFQAVQQASRACVQVSTGRVLQL